MAPPVIMLIRHGEKPDGDIGGVLLDGSDDIQSLTVQGWQRAGALATMFDPARGSLPSAAMAIPQFLFAAHMNPDTEKDSKRPVQTLQPLSLKLNLDINDSFKKKDPTDMVAQAITCNGPVLIAWQHDQIPAIGNAITGNSTTVPQEWPAERFDMVWVFAASSGGGYEFTQVPQLLLAGDLATPIS